MNLQKNITIDLNEKLRNNKTGLWLHVMVTAPNSFYKAPTINDPRHRQSIKDMKDITFFQSLNLIKIRKRIKQRPEENLMSSFSKELSDQSAFDHLTPEEHYWPHLKPFVDINTVVDFTFYPENQVNGFLMRYQQFDLSLNVYTPPLFLNDYWITSDKFVELNETQKTITLNYNSY